MNGIELLEKLEANNTTTETEGKQFEIVLNKIGFPRARVVCGVVYLEGKGTLTCPPTDIHSVAKMVLDGLRKEGLI